MQPGVTLRDLVNAIPLYAIKAGLLTVEKQGKKNVFSGRILEIEGLPDLKIEQAFELADASAERSSAGCTVQAQQGADHRVPQQQHRAAEVDDRARLFRIRVRIPVASRPRWKPGWPIRSCCRPDADAEYAAVIEIDLAEITSPSSAVRMIRMTRRRCRMWPARRSTRSSSVRA
jgi:aconitate hydratase 2/2-methylisocitrate dehydratase